MNCEQFRMQTNAGRAKAAMPRRCVRHLRQCTECRKWHDDQQVFEQMLTCVVSGALAERASSEVLSRISSRLPVGADTSTPGNGLDMRSFERPESFLERWARAAAAALVVLAVLSSGILASRFNGGFPRTPGPSFEQKEYEWRFYCL